jgi:hypothetical protein
MERTYVKHFKSIGQSDKVVGLPLPVQLLPPQLFQRRRNRVKQLMMGSRRGRENAPHHYLTLGERPGELVRLQDGYDGNVALCAGFDEGLV